jgi:hypothetical protein
MRDYIAEVLSNRVQEVTDSRTHQFPPWYERDASEWRNCYAHAFDIHVEDRSRNVFIPGMMSEYMQKEGISVIQCPFIDIYSVNQIIEAVISDANVMEIDAVETEMDAPYKTSNSYKIFLCEDTELGLWHFARESRDEIGNIIITHKGSYKLPSGILIREGDYFVGAYYRYKVLATLELSEKMM